jgi:hypothetical protein
MRRKHQRSIELIFARPTSGNVQWRDIEALFVELGAEGSEREGSRVAVVLFEEVRVFHRPHPSSVNLHFLASLCRLPHKEYYTWLLISL